MPMQFSRPTQNLIDTIDRARKLCQDLSLSDFRSAIAHEDDAPEALEEALSQLQKCAQQLRSACRSMGRQAIKQKKDTNPFKTKFSVLDQVGAHSEPQAFANRNPHPRSAWAREILGVTPFAPAEQLRQRYYQLLRATHPDTRSQSSMEEPSTPSFEQVREAWTILREDGACD